MSTSARDPTFRRPGIGKALLDELKKIAQDDPEKFAEELEKTSKQEEIRQFFDKEVGRICRTIFDTWSQFGLVRWKLAKFEDNHRFEMREKGLTPIIPRWDRFHYVRRIS